MTDRHRPTVRLNIRLSPTERTRLRRLAAQHQRPLGRYLVERGLSGAAQDGMSPPAARQQPLVRLRRANETLDRLTARLVANLPITQAELLQAIAEVTAATTQVGAWLRRSRP